MTIVVAFWNRFHTLRSQRKGRRRNVQAGLSFDNYGIDVLEQRHMLSADSTTAYALLQAAHVSAFQSAPVAMPSAPLDVLATVGHQKVFLTWKPPVASGGVPVSQYVVQYKLSSSPTGTTASTLPSETQSTVVPGILSNNIYQFRVTAFAEAVAGRPATVNVFTSTMPASAPDPISAFAYQPIANGITITGYTGSSSVVRIPDMIDGKPVTVVGPEAFRDRTGISRVVLPAGLTSIESGAFFNCSTLNAVTIPAGVTHIADGAFAGTKLVTLALPARLQQFDNCVYACPRLTSITVARGNPFYLSIDGILYDKTVHTVVRCPEGRTKDVVVPKSVTTVAAYAFHRCDNLKSIVLPSSITAMGNDAFRYCNHLRQYLAPARDTPRGSYLTYTITGVDSVFVTGFSGSGTVVRIPEKIGGRFVVGIDETAFANQGRLTSIMIPDRVTVFGNAAFTGCSSLLTLTLPSCLEYIGFNAFQYCTSLTSITIPAKVTHIGAVCFFGCSNLQTISVDPANVNYASSLPCLYNKAMTELIVCPAGWSHRVSIPSGVKMIDGLAFYGCTKVGRIFIPSDIDAIDPRAFEGCDATRTFFDVNGGGGIVIT